jgi:hypothetical protein
MYGILELNHRFGHYVTHYFILECRRPKYNMMSYKDVMDGVANGKKWVFLDEYVLDIKWFRWSHPGGSVVFEKCIGEDMGKYLSGCSSTGGYLNPYAHSP